MQGMIDNPVPGDSVTFGWGTGQGGGFAARIKPEALDCIKHPPLLFQAINMFSRQPIE